jgi:rhodanese-related sulfurtransferase
LIRLRQGSREAAILLLAAAALGFIYTAATEKGMFAPPPPAAPIVVAGIVAPAMITREQAQTDFESGSALFIDARHEFDYKLGHIKGAINIPLRMYDKKKDLLTSVPKNRLLVVYCDGAECNSSIELSTTLAKEGYTDVKIFFGGWRDWSSANLPIEKSP